MEKMNRNGYTREKLEADSIRAVKVYFDAAKDKIDKMFGEGYAQNNPTLLGSMIQAMANEFSAGSIAMALEASGDLSKQGLESVAFSVANK